MTCKLSSLQHSTTPAALLFSLSHFFKKPHDCCLQDARWHVSCSKLISVPLAQLRRNSLVCQTWWHQTEKSSKSPYLRQELELFHLITDSTADYSVTKIDGLVCFVNSETPPTLRLTGINRETDTSIVDRSVCKRAWGGDEGIDSLSGRL